ncbi:MAG: hypothetical protein AB8G86_21640 [Saprospiraceae bacterium]
MELEKVINFLHKEGWEKAKTNGEFVFYKSPTDIGLSDNYTLPIPILTTTNEADFPRRLDEAIDFLSEVYEVTPEKLFYEVGNYLEVLKGDALFFTLKSDEVRFSHTLELNDITQFLKNLSVSYENFIRIKFQQKFSEFYNNDPFRINKTVNKLLTFSKLRLVDLEFESFSFGVSVDTQMGNEQLIKEMRGFRKALLTTYKKEVIEVDFMEEKAVQQLIQKFSISERKAIFEPFLKSINQEAYSIILTNSKFTPQIAYRRIPQSTIKLIIPSKVKEQVTANVKMMQIIVPVDKTKSKITIRTKEIENDLFSQPIEEYKITVDTIESGEEKIKLKEKVDFTIQQSKDTSEFLVIFKPLAFELKVKEFGKIKDEFFAAFISNLNYYKYIIKRGEKITKPSEKRLVKFFGLVLPD